MRKKRRSRRKEIIQTLSFIFYMAIIAVIMFAPIFIKVNGERIINVEVFTQYKDQGAQSIFGGDVKVENNVNTSIVGKYKVKYKFLTQTYTRTVNVVDTTSPEITIDDFDEIYVYVNDNFTAPSATANDNYDGDISDKIDLINYVDTSKVGDYQLIYTVFDSSENVGNKIVTVHVCDQDEFFNKKTGDITTRVLETIKNFTNSYHKSLKYLQFDNCSELFSSDEYYYIYNQLHQFTIDVRKNSPVNLYLSDVSYDLDITSCSQTSYGYLVKLYETYSQTYAYYDDNTATHEVFCSYKLDEDYKIIGLYREESIYYSYLEDYQETNNYKSEIKEFINNVSAKYQKTHKEFLEQLEAVNSGTMTIENTITKTAKYSYNRQAAANYAIKYALNQNEDYHFFSGGNCVNFCSQAMVAGGIKMVYTGSGSQQWKYYDYYVNHQEGKEGYTLSWSAIYYFMRFSNSQDSVVIQTCVSPFLAEKGDMLLFAQDSETYNHATLVSDVITDEQGNILDILYCGSTNNVRNGSFWASVTGYMELEKIIGSN